MYIKVGDNVAIIAGSDRGETGKVKKIYRKNGKAIVEGRNIVVKKIKKTKDQRGKEVKKEAPIHISNLSLVADDKKPSRVGFRLDADGKKERFSKRTGKKI